MTWTHSHSLMHSTHASQDVWVITTRPHLLALWSTLLAHTSVGDVGALVLCVPMQPTLCNLLVPAQVMKPPRWPSATSAPKGVGPYILCPILLN